MYDMEALRRLRENFDFDSEKERRQFAKQLESLVQSWTVHLSILNLTLKDVDTDCDLLTEAHRKSQLPDFNLILKKEEIDRLLTDALYGTNRFISLAIKTGYKDEPDLDSVGKPVTRRTTALHRAARLIRQVSSTLVRDLFRVYDKFDANYVDEDGLTHLHVACLFGCEDVVEKFLDHGADPNCRAKQTGYTTLHLATRLGSHDMVRLLLEYGANPNLADEQGRTALHSICQELGDDWFLAQMLLVLCHDEFRPVLVDARDKRGDTPLNLAMESENEMLVRLLLKNGADRTLTDKAEDVMSRELAKLERLAGVAKE
ncbi:unnamed protein product [Trichogramma brassicae]|uniref:Uncharacterized protein n=1 Tax=Trichogramma brassicae TaxID=86971 RepID=A0A6H5HXK3_9HYME|nr:unnamed protein product [Trichogramma brassicae]